MKASAIEEENDSRKKGQGETPPVLGVEFLFPDPFYSSLTHVCVLLKKAKEPRTSSFFPPSIGVTLHL